MTISNYLWPFQRKFSEVPCAREAALVALLGGVGIGSTSIVITRKMKYAFKSSVYTGFALFWISLGVCRYQMAKMKQLSEQFIEAYERGDID